MMPEQHKSKRIARHIMNPAQIKCIPPRGLLTHIKQQCVSRGFMDSLVDRDCVKEILESVPLVSCILCCQTDLIHDGMPLMALFYVAGARDIVPRARL